MDHDSTDHPIAPAQGAARFPAGSAATGPDRRRRRSRDIRRRGGRRSTPAGSPRGAGRGDRRRPAGGRPRGHRKRGAAGADLSRRLPHAQCRKRRAVRRQGEKRPQAAFFLRPRQRAAAGAHPAHDRCDRDGRDRLHHDRDRSAAAGSQPDQAAAAALQRATARRQVVSLHPDIRRPLGAADPQTSRRADPGPDDISGRSHPPAPSTAPSRRCSAPS